MACPHRHRRLRLRHYGLGSPHQWRLSRKHGHTLSCPLIRQPRFPIRAMHLLRRWNLWWCCRQILRLDSLFQKEELLSHWLYHRYANRHHAVRFTRCLDSKRHKSQIRRSDVATPNYPLIHPNDELHPLRPRRNILRRFCSIHASSLRQRHAEQRRCGYGSRWYLPSLHLHETWCACVACHWRAVSALEVFHPSYDLPERD